MTALPRHRMTADEFLVWAEAQPKEAGRFELWDGEVIVKRGPTGQQQSERARHWEAKFSIATALKAAVKKSGLRCYAVPEGASLRVTDSRGFEPDRARRASITVSSSRSISSWSRCSIT
jgi:Uma2 family endonuclease